MCRPCSHLLFLFFLFGLYPHRYPVVVPCRDLGNNTHVSSPVGNLDIIFADVGSRLCLVVVPLRVAPVELVHRDGCFIERSSALRCAFLVCARSV